MQLQQQRRRSAGSLTAPSCMRASTAHRQQSADVIYFISCCLAARWELCFDKGNSGITNLPDKGCLTTPGTTTAQFDPAIWQGTTCLLCTCAVQECSRHYHASCHLAAAAGSTWQSRPLEPHTVCSAKGHGPQQGPSRACYSHSAVQHSKSLSALDAPNSSRQVMCEGQLPLQTSEPRCWTVPVNKDGIYMTQLCLAGARTGETTSAAPTLQQCPAPQSHLHHHPAPT